MKADDLDLATIRLQEKYWRNRMKALASGPLRQLREAQKQRRYWMRAIDRKVAKENLTKVN